MCAPRQWSAWRGSSIRATRCGWRSGSGRYRRKHSLAAARTASFSVTSSRSAYRRRSAHPRLPGDHRQQHPRQRGLPDHDPHPGGPGIVKQWMGGVGLDDHDAGRPAGPARVRPGTEWSSRPGRYDDRIADHPRPQPVHRLTPQHAAATARKPTRVAPRHTMPPSCSASGCSPGTRADSGRQAACRHKDPSTPANQPASLSPPRQGASDAVASTPPISTIATRPTVSPTRLPLQSARPPEHQGHQPHPDDGPDSTRTFPGAEHARHQAWSR